MSVYRLQDTELMGTGRWLEELMLAMRWVDRGHAMNAVKAALHLLRDHLPGMTASSLGAQLPLVMRGVYYEGWIAEQPHPDPRDRSELLAELRAQLPKTEATNTEVIARAVFALLQRHMELPKIDEIARALPKVIRDLWLQS